MKKVSDIFELDVNGYSEIEADGFEFIEDLIPGETASSCLPMQPLPSSPQWAKLNSRN